MLELKNVFFSVPSDEGTKDIIKDVSFTVGDGKFVAVTGPNGSGKSTLARLIMGIEKPTSGSIIFNGTDITDMSITDRANMGISFALQQPVRFKGIKVIDLLRIAAKRRLTVSEACEYLSSVGLCARDYIDREVNSSLSGGELKRIEIATSLALGTVFSIFDEPEAGIDLWSFQSLIHVFENMQKQTNGSILVISHQERILDIADEIILLAAGSVKNHGTRDEILPELLRTSSPVTCNKLTDKLPAGGSKNG